MVKAQAVHSPIPWRAGKHGDIIDGGFGWAVANVYNVVNCGQLEARREAKANQRLIVRAVNSHQWMLDALKEVGRILVATRSDDDPNEPGEASAADIVEMLCNVEGLVFEAIARGEGRIP